jgi:hypothetical protein
MNMSTPAKTSYTAEQARKDYTKPWLSWSRAVDLVKKFGFTEWNFRQCKHLIEQKELPCTDTRYSLESIIKIFS